MLSEKIDELLKSAMKEKEVTKVNVLKLIKSEFSNFLHSGVGKELNEIEENRILQRMVRQREDSIKQYNDGGRPELATIEQEEKSIIETFLPEKVSNDVIVDFTQKTIEELQKEKGEEYVVSMKDMKAVSSVVEAKFSCKCGKIISEVLKLYITTKSNG